MSMEADSPWKSPFPFGLKGGQGEETVFALYNCGLIFHRKSFHWRFEISDVLTFLAADFVSAFSKNFNSESQMVIKG